MVASSTVITTIVLVSLMLFSPFNVLYENISKYEYDDKTKILTLYGKIIGDTYENGELKTSDEYNEISLLDVYDFSVKQLLDENC